MAKVSRIPRPTLAATVVISLVSADRRLSVTVHANGIVATPTNRPPVTDCYGKTLDELRSSGRLIEPQRAK